MIWGSAIWFLIEMGVQDSFQVIQSSTRYITASTVDFVIDTSFADGGAHDWKMSV